MSAGMQVSNYSVSSLRREVCDKCGTRMELDRWGHGFERWACAFCRQVVRINRDPKMAGAISCIGGHPWRWSAQAFRT